jgi:tape measure domain-containing protein
MAMTSILGDSGKAAQLLDDLKKFAATTPFEFTELAQTTKQLLAYGFAQDQIITTSKTLGDVAAGLNIPFSDLAYLYGTLRAQQVAYTKDMNQFANRGIPIWDEVAQVMGKTVPEVRKLVEAGEVGFPIIEQAFVNMTSEGGKFNNLMQAQMATTAGQFSNLKDSVGFLARDLGTLLLPTAMQLIQALMDLVNWVNSLSEGQKQLIVTIAAVVAGIGPLLIILGLLVNGISAVIGVVGVLSSAFIFLITSPLTWIVIAIAAVVAAGIWLVKHWDDVKAAAQQLGSWVASQWETLKNKIRALGNQILDAIMWPFEEAKRRVQEAVNFIKDRLDFTQRHSPSVVDIVKHGVAEVNKALMDLPADISIGTNVAAVGASASGTSSQIAVRVDMNGALIGDMTQASRLGEMLGDGIIKRLQQNIRI